MADELNDTGSGAPEEAAPAGETTPPVSPPSEGGQGPAGPPAAPSWGGPTEDDWKAVVGALHYISTEMGLGGQQEPEAPDFENMTPAELVQAVVDSRLSEYAPALQHSAKESGQQRMNALFDEEEAKIGKFDRGLADKLAQAIFNEVGDPERAVRMGAAEAKRVRDEYGQAAVEEYKKSLKSTPFSDPEVGGGGERTPLQAKTYDEVIAKYTGEEEV